MQDLTTLNQRSKGHFPDVLGIKFIECKEGVVVAEMPIRKEFFASNGFLHAGSIVTFADTVAGYSTLQNLPKQATSFTTLELKSNFIGATKGGTLISECMPDHIGKTTQVWRVKVLEKATGKTIAIFSCTQLILY